MLCPQRKEKRADRRKRADEDIDVRGHDFDSCIYFSNNDRRFIRARLRLFTHSHPVRVRASAAEGLW